MEIQIQLISVIILEVNQVQNCLSKNKNARFLYNIQDSMIDYIEPCFILYHYIKSAISKEQILYIGSRVNT